MENNVLEEHISDEEIEEMFENAKKPKTDMENLIQKLGEYTSDYDYVDDDEEYLPAWAREHITELDKEEDGGVKSICEETLDEMRAAIKVVRASHFKIDDLQDKVKALTADIAEIKAMMNALLRSPQA
jgi:uncharacterized membrane protein